MSEARSQTFIIRSREAALQFIIDQFAACAEDQLKALAAKARAVKVKLAQQQQAEVTFLRERLREQLEAVLAQQHFPPVKWEAAYQALRLLSGFWPANSPYVPDEGEAKATAGTPTCTICLCGISPGTEILTSHHYLLHTVCLVGALARRPGFNPNTNLPYSARDMHTIKERAREKGFTVVDPVVPMSNLNRPFPWSFKYMVGFFFFTIGAAITGAFSFFLAPVLCGVGMAGFLGMMAHFLYRTGQERRTQERQWTLYQEELALAQAIELSLRPENNPQAVLRNREMDFLYDPSGRHAAAAAPNPRPRRVAIPPPALSSRLSPLCAPVSRPVMPGSPPEAEPRSQVAETGIQRPLSPAGIRL